MYEISDEISENFKAILHIQMDVSWGDVSGPDRHTQEHVY